MYSETFTVWITYNKVFWWNTHPFLEYRKHSIIDHNKIGRIEQSLFYCKIEQSLSYINPSDLLLLQSKVILFCYTPFFPNPPMLIGNKKKLY